MLSPELSKALYPLQLDLHLVHELMEYTMPAWCIKELSPGSSLIIDTINACTAEEQHKLMLIFPEEVMAYTLYFMNRNSRFLTNLLGDDHDELDRLLNQLKKINDQQQESAEPKKTPREMH